MSAVLLLSACPAQSALILSAAEAAKGENVIVSMVSAARR
jgi:hypothetical protein